MAVQPIFIFSLPRSGSTLVQRVIAAHEGVATASEPWVLLPYMYAFKQEGVIAEYDHPQMVRAIQDFCRQLPGGEADYRRQLREFVLGLYERASGPDALYFLDKTPPYGLVASEIMELFPDGRFVFLWRNPIGVIASIIETLNGGRWHPTLFRGDLFVGLPRLVAAFEANRSRVHAVRFEDLLGGDERRWRQLMDYLGIDFDPRSLDRFSEVQLNGRMGDPTGIKQYASLSADPLEKWRGVLANPLRLAWCRRYLQFLGAERLATMGYELDELLEQLSSQPLNASGVVNDLGGLARDLAREPLRARMHRGRTDAGTNALRQLLRA